MRHEALFYQAEDDNKISCCLCPHRCVIADGKFGYCGVRKNIDGKLFSMIYGRVSSACADAIEKKPLYHFSPVVIHFQLVLLVAICDVVIVKIGK